MLREIQKTAQYISVTTPFRWKLPIATYFIEVQASMIISKLLANVESATFASRGPTSILNNKRRGVLLLQKTKVGCEICNKMD